MRILFVCSRNKWRSRTAERIFRDRGHDEVKSAGTEKDAQVKVSDSLIEWADRIYVMEDHHLRKLKERFNEALKEKEVIVLGIEDRYRFMDPELIEVLKVSVDL